jgi:hypothetical protein
VNGVSANPKRTMWCRGRGRRSYLRGRAVAATVPSFALPGGNAP